MKHFYSSPRLTRRGRERDFGLGVELYLLVLSYKQTNVSVFSVVKKLKVNNGCKRNSLAFWRFGETAISQLLFDVIN